MSPAPLRFALLGTGFWSRYQLAGWRETGAATCVAVFNRTRSKAEAVARDFGIPAVYDSAEELLAREQIDFVDICTDVGTHAVFTGLAAARGLAVVCQKPLGRTLEEAEAMAAGCARAGVRLIVNENWRWQAPLRAAHEALAAGAVGRVFRARIDFSNAFDVFANQPFLRELDQFILTDIGSHILDVARLLFGEATELSCRTQRVHADIRGEDVATVHLRTDRGADVTCAMSYAGNPYEHHRFPETLVFAEGVEGTLELAADGWLRVTTRAGTHARRVVPPRHAWADPAYDLVHASIVPCQAHIAASLRDGTPCETEAADNLRTVRLVFASYASARRGVVVDPRDFQP